MTDDIEFEEIGIEEKKVLLDVLGYEVDDNGIIFDKSTQKEHVCPVTGDPVFVENASILPGSTIVIKTTELSLAEYFTNFVEKISG